MKHLLQKHSKYLWLSLLLLLVGATAIAIPKINGINGINDASVAKIGDTEYATLQAAVDAAQNGETVTLFANTTENVVVPVGKDITLSIDKNVTLSGGGSSNKKAAIENKGTLTIKGSGTIKREDTAAANGDGQAAYYVILNNGTMTISGVTVTNDSGPSVEGGKWSGSSLICNGTTSTSPSLTISGGTYTQNNFIVIKNDDYGTLNITGGTFNSKDQAVQNWNTTTITGGTFNGDVKSWAWEGNGAQSNPTISINGGTFNNCEIGTAFDGTPASNSPTLAISKGTFNNCTLEKAEGSELTISGGTFNGGSDPTEYGYEPSFMVTKADGTISYASLTTISAAGTYKLLKDVELYRIGLTTNMDKITIDLNGHTLAQVSGYTSFCLLYATKSITVNEINIIDTSAEKGGKIIANTGGNAVAAISIGKQVSNTTVNIGEGVTIEGNTVLIEGTNNTLNVEGTINGGNDFAVCTNGSTTTNATINIKEGAVLTSDVTALYLPGNTGLNATIEGGTITGGDCGIEVRAGNLVVNGGTITTTATEYNYTANGNGTTTKGAAIAVVQHNTLLPTDAQILGGTLTGLNQIAVVDAQNNNLDGVTIKAKDDFIATTVLPDAFKWQSNGDGTSTLAPKTYVAQIGTTKYETLQAAFAAAQDGETITLLADCAGNGIQVLPNRFATTGLTVDFDGHTYTVDGDLTGSTGTKTQAFQLQMNNKITFQNGTIYSEKAKMLVNNYSDLTLDGMTLTLNNANYTSGYTLSDNNGNVVINNTTINANPAGKFAFDVCRGGGGPDTYKSVHVTVTGNSVINGDIEIDAKNGAAVDGFSLMLAGGTHTGDIVLTDNAKAAMEATPDKAVIQKSDSYVQDAPEGYKWVSDGNGTSTLAPKTYVAQIGTTKYETIEAAINAATAGQTITLLADIDATSQIEVGKQVTLDLNGKTIEYKGSNTLSSGVIMVLRGGDLTVTDSSEDATGAIKSGTKAYAAIILTKLGETSTETAKLTVNNGTLEGDYYGITGNGSRHGTEITINGGVIKGTHEKDNLGIYHPQDGTLTITGGTISGYGSAVEMRAGTLSVKGGTLSASCTEFTYNPNDNGSTTNGAVIAIAQHNTLKAINVNVSGATLNGAKTIAVTDAQKNNLQNISVTVADGLTENSYIPAAFKWVSDGTMSTLTPRDPIAKIDETVYYSLADAIAAVPTDGTETTITLLANVTENVVVKDGKNIVLDLDSKTLTGYIDQYDSNINVKNGTIAGTVYVNGAGTSTDNYNTFTLADDATITADYGIILYQAEGTNAAYGSTIDINGTVNGMVWVMGNITEGNSVINVNSGASIKGDVGVALNGVATLNVAANTSIEGAEVGIEVRAGNLNVAGGNIKSTSTEYKVESNGSGTTTYGAAIAVAQHTTGLPINANITGGTLSGIKTISVADPEGGNYAGVVVTAKDELTEGEVVIPDGYIWISNNDGTSTLTKAEHGEYVLIDGEDYPFMNLKSDISVPEVTYKRSFSEGQINKHQAWFVPMDYTITADDAENFTFYKIQMIAGAAEAGEADHDLIYLYIEPMSEGEILRGNRPYTVKPKNAVSNYEFTADGTKLYAPNTGSRLNVTTSFHSYDFYGKYARESYSGSVGDMYYLSGGSLHPNNATTTLLPYRWIIKVTANTINDDYSKIEFSIVEDGDATGIDRTHVIDSDEVEGIYTTNGMKVDEPVRGINIIRYKNGKTEKIIVK